MKWLERNRPIFDDIPDRLHHDILVLLVRNDYRLFLIWAQPPVYFTHEFEEQVLPGGFVKWFNHRVLGSPATTGP